MENFATKKLKDLITELEAHKLKEEKILDTKIGITKQFVRENIEGIDKAIGFVNTALKEITAM